MTTRTDRLVAAVAEQGLDAVVITHLPNLRWAIRLERSNSIDTLNIDDTQSLFDGSDPRKGYDFTDSSAPRNSRRRSGGMTGTGGGTTTIGTTTSKGYGY